MMISNGSIDCYHFPKETEHFKLSFIRCPIYFSGNFRIESLSLWTKTNLDIVFNESLMVEMVN